MKKIILFFVLLFYVFATAQNYPGKMPELLLNKQVKVLEVPESNRKYGYDDFYKDKSLTKKYACCDSYNSKYDKLVNRTFTVKEVKSFGSSDYMLTLEDGKETIYFKYDPKYEFKFPFETIGGLTLPEDFYCDRIYNGVKNGESIFSSKIDEGMKFSKFIKNGSVLYFVSMNMSSYEEVIKEEATLLLENGTIIKAISPIIKAKPREDLGGYVYNAFFNLTPEDVELLQQYKIVGQTIDSIKEKTEQGDSHKGVFNCLVASGKELELKSGSGFDSGCNYRFSKSSDDVREGWDLILSPTIEDITFLKMRERSTGVEEYQVHVMVISPEQKLDKQSGILLLTGGASIDQPNAEVKCRAAADGNGYELYVYMELSKEHIELLKTNSIAGKMVYLVDKRITQGDKLRKIFNCLLQQ